MTDILLDTTFFIDVWRGNDAGADSLWYSIKDGKLTGSVSAVTAYELWVGAGLTREEELLYESMLALLEPAAITVSAARTAGLWLRQQFERTEMLFRDALIAATARERGEAICTRNRQDFVRFPDVRVETY